MYRWVEHTGEVALEIRADAEEAVYAEALEAMAELLGDEPGDRHAMRTDPRASGGPALREVAVEAADRPGLLVEFLGELAFLAETERFVPEGLERLTAEGERLQATVRGRLGDPPHLVKAATYHGLSFDAVDGGWRATVVLDV